MQERRLGLSGPSVSALGLGGNNFGRPGSATEDLPGTIAVVDAALEAGITLIDTADIYNGGTSEKLLSKALAHRRDAVFLASKFGHREVDTGIAAGSPKGSREYIRAAISASLNRLQFETLDLYQMHTPDPTTDIRITIQALEELVTEGRIRYYGHSNFSARQIAEAAAASRELGVRGFISAQDEYSLLNRGAAKDRIPAAQREGIGFLPYYPLANGLLTGKFGRNERPADSRIARQRPELAERAPWDRIEQFAQYCSQRGISMLQATFGWLLAEPGLTSIIAGATTPEQVSANATAAKWEPTSEDIAEISRIFANQ